MKVNLMRYIDYYAGVPLTFIITVLTKIFSIFRSSKGAKPKNILFIELSEMGSAILSDPAMRKAKMAFDAELFFCIFLRNRDSLFLLNTIEAKNIFVIRENNFINLALDSLKFLFWTRSKHVDTVIDLELFSRFTALLTGLSGARDRVGFFRFYNEGLYRGDMLTHKVAYNAHIHIAKNFVALVNALISSNGEIPYSKTIIQDVEVILSKARPPDEEKDRMWKRIKEQYPALDKKVHHIILMNPNASDLLLQRRWPLNNFSRLIRMVLDYDECAVVVITGSPSEYDQMQGLLKSVDKDRCVNFAGKTLLTELPALYSISTLMVTNESGPAHFCAVTDIPSFILFGPETPSLYGPLGNSTPIYAGLACSPCVTAANYRKTPCRNNICLKVISAEIVFDKIKPLLKRRCSRII
jgi:ADP-heptose:LPS heptosyltransferase